MQHLCSLPYSAPESSVLHALSHDAEFMDQRFPANARLHSRAHFEDVAGRYRKRAQAVDVIRSSMAGLELSDAQQASLSLLAQDKTLIVISGQQTGIYGGPAFTALKAAGAIELARRLSAAHADFAVLPIFWMEDNDHDVEEISAVDFLNRSQGAVQTRLRWPGLRRRTMVSELQFGDTLEELERDWQAQAHPSLHSDETFEVLRAAYRVGSTPARAFRDWMQTLFADSGLLLVTASECRRAGLFADIARQELAQPGESQKCMQPVLQDFAARGINAQVQPSAINLFYVEKGRRMKLDLDSARNWTAEGLPVERSNIEAAFERDAAVLTPNVLLRPIMQDQIFPTLAYIAGPGERSYAAEIRELYARFDVPMPAFVPRPHATLLSAGFERRRAQVPIDFADLRRSSDAFTQELNKRWTPDDWLQESAGFASSISAIYADVRKQVAQVDSSLDAIAEQELNNSLAGLERLNAKVRRSMRRRHHDDLQRLLHMHAEYFPRGGPQDRHTSAAFMAYRYGIADFRNFVHTAAELWNAGEMIFTIAD